MTRRLAAVPDTPPRAVAYIRVSDERGRVVYLECSRREHVQAFPPAPDRARTVQRALILHNRSHGPVG